RHVAIGRLNGGVRTRSNLPPAGLSRWPFMSEHRDPASRVVAIPADANACGDISRGCLPSLIGRARGPTAAPRAKGRAGRGAMAGMVFHQPVKVGDEVSVYTDIERVGRTSMVIEVEAWRRERHCEDSTKVTEAKFTFVAIDEQGRPRAVEPE